jgi:hypothetical protein
LSPSAINARRGGSRQAHTGIGFLNDLRKQTITTDETAGRVQQHQICRAVGKLNRGERLQRELEAALPKGGSSESPLESQAKEAVAPYAFRIRRGESDGSNR